MSDAQFITGQSDPHDFTADEVKDHMTASDNDEVARIQAMESAEGGKGRVSVLNWEREPEPAPAPAPADEDAPPAYTDADRPAVGDTLADEGDGFTRVVVSA